MQLSYLIGLKESKDEWKKNSYMFDRMLHQAWDEIDGLKKQIKTQRQDVEHYWRPHVEYLEQAMWIDGK